MPTNLARLHASLAHYCPKRDHYDVKVLCVPSPEEAAQMIRRVSEETHKNCKVCVCVCMRACVRVYM